MHWASGQMPPLLLKRLSGRPPQWGAASRWTNPLPPAALRCAAALCRTHTMASAVSVPLGKPQGDFRVYESSGGVYEHYKAMRLNQCLAFSQRMTAKWGGGFGTRPGGRMTVKAALQLCDTFVDRSDPDTLLPNSIHMLQAAEACRAAGKPDWFCLCALLHDIGKLMYKWGSCEDGQGGTAVDPQWALGGVRLLQPPFLSVLGRGILNAPHPHAHAHNAAPLAGHVGGGLPHSALRSVPCALCAQPGQGRGGLSQLAHGHVRPGLRHDECGLRLWA